MMSIAPLGPSVPVLGARRLPGDRTTVSIQALEWWGAWVVLILQTGAFLPLLLMKDGEPTSETARFMLQMTHLPVLVYSGLILARRPQLFVIAGSRNLALILLLCFALLSAAWSISLSQTIKSVAALFSSTILGFALAITYSPRQLLSLVASSFGWLMVASLLLFLMVPDLGRMSDMEAMRGAFVHKNPMGWCATVSFLAYAMLLTDKSRRDRARTGLFLLITGICLGLSASMTGMLSVVSAIFVGLFCVALPRQSGFGRLVFSLVFLQAICATAVVLSAFTVPMLEYLEKDATLTGRIPLWQLVDAQIANRFLLGYGYGTFWTDGNGAAWHIWSELQWKAPNAHSGIREVLLNIGFVGLLLLIWIVMRGVYQGLACQCRSPGTGWLWLIVYLGMFLVMNITESLMMVQGVFWTLFCVAVVSFSTDRT
ncbi:MAG: O-antigen ligase family protein [Paracoccaceae bacterium]